MSSRAARGRQFVSLRPLL